MRELKFPQKLYKYRSFNEYTLQLFTKNIYYSKPIDFNDPLDCKPEIDIGGVEGSSLERLCLTMLTEEFDKDRANKLMNEIKHNSSQYGDYRIDPHARTAYNDGMITWIRNILYKEMGAYGVLSLAKKWNCPLMWSHYADNHKGLCFEYDTTKHVFKNIDAVNYCGSRSINVSDLIEWKLNNSDLAKQRIINTYFYSKAPDWKYEHEWRDICKTQGNLPAPVVISAVYFGMRCDNTILNMIECLYSQDRHIKLYKIEADKNSFKLKRRKLNFRDKNEPSYISLQTSALDLVDLPTYE